MATLQGFDATQVLPEDREAIPAGWYPATIVKSSLERSKNGRSKYLLLQIELSQAAGVFKGRTFFARINRENDNRQAVEIGDKELSAVCHATGILRPRDSSEFHHRPFQVRLRIKPAEGKYDEGNEVAGFKPLDRAAVPGPSPAAAPVASRPPSSVTPPYRPPAPAPAPPPPPAPPAPVNARNFWVFPPGAKEPEFWGELKLKEALAQGLPIETPIMPEGETNWTTAPACGVAALPPFEADDVPMPATPTPLATTPAPAPATSVPWRR